MDKMITLRGLGGVMVNILVQMQVASLNPQLGTIFSLFITLTPMTPVGMTMILYKLQIVRLLNLPCGGW